MNKTILLFAFILAACNPYASIATPTPTAQPTGTATAKRGVTFASYPSPSPTPQTCTVTTGVQAGNLNIRSGAGTSYAVIKVLREGQAVIVIDRYPRGNWIQIKAADVIGWINSTYCKIGE